MTIVSNAGYNASTSQNQVTKLRFKTSNGGSNNGGFYGDGSAYRLIPLGTNSVSPSIIRVVQTSTTSYKIYGSFSTFTGGGSFYQVSIPDNTSWTNSSTTVSTPTGTYIDIRPTSSFTPAGAIIYVAQNSAPDGYIKANGATISRDTYSDLFSAIGTTFGAGDGSSTFVIPDLRGEFIRAWDDSRGIDSGRSFGTAQGEGLTAMRGEIYDSHGRAAMNTTTFGSGNNVFESTGSNSSYRTALQTSSTAYNGIRFDSTNVIAEATSGGLRPRNIALLACIKY